MMPMMNSKINSTPLLPPDKKIIKNITTKTITPLK